jgi:uncharacterized repeat protein (TIGR03803 family)
MDASGALYGTTIGGGAFNRDGTGNGTVFKLTPPLDPEKNEWTESLLWCFAGGEDGQSPSSGLTMDSTGALYGTTHYGGRGTCQDGQGSVVGCGTVFKLIPPNPEKNKWTKKTLYKFKGSPDGGLPMGGVPMGGGKPAGTLLLDATGAIYGTTYGGGASGGGTVFKITPPSAEQTDWTESVLFSFAGSDGAGPQGGLIADESGQLYGTASGGGNLGFGVVFRLSAQTTGQLPWKEDILHDFDNTKSGDTPFYGLVADPQGNLFGTAFYGGGTTPDGGTGLFGTIFEITP